MMILWKTIFLISSILTFPCLLLSSNATFTPDIKDLWNVRHTSILKTLLITFILNFLLALSDVTSDVVASVYYFISGDYFYSMTTIGVTFLPFTVKVIQETAKIFNWLRKDTNVFKCHWKAIVCSSIKNISKHFPFFLPYVNLRRMIRLLRLEENVKIEKCLLKLQEESNLEPFLESAPQMALQLYIWMNTQKTSAPLVFSIVTSSLSLGMASSSTYLFERVLYPVASVGFATKIIMAPIFITVTLPRLLTLALLTNLLNDWSGKYSNYHLEKIFILVFFCALVAVLHLSVRYISFSKLPDKPVWNPNLRDGVIGTNEFEFGADFYESDGVIGEYQLEKQTGFDDCVADIQRKSVFISVFCPSIVLFEESGLFAVTSIASTVYYIVALIAGWILMNVDGEFSYRPTVANTTYIIGTTTRAPPNEDEDITGWIFPLCFALLILSAGSQTLLWYLSDHINLHRFTRGLFTHPSLIALGVDKLAAKEYAMERKKRIAEKERQEGEE